MLNSIVVVVALIIHIVIVVGLLVVIWFTLSLYKLPHGDVMKWRIKWEKGISLRMLPIGSIAGWLITMRLRH